MTITRFTINLKLVVFISALTFFWGHIGAKTSIAEKRVEIEGREPIKSLPRELTDRVVEGALRNYKQGKSTGSGRIDKLFESFSKDQRNDYKRAFEDNEGGREAMRRLLDQANQVISKEKIFEVKDGSDGPYKLNLDLVNELAKKVRQQAGTDDAGKRIRESLNGFEAYATRSVEQSDRIGQVIGELNRLGNDVKGGPNASASLDSEALGNLERELRDRAGSSGLTSNEADRMMRTIQAVREEAKKLGTEQGKLLTEAALLRIEDVLARSETGAELSDLLQSIESGMKKPNALQVELGNLELVKAGLKAYRENLLNEAKKQNIAGAEKMSTHELKAALAEKLGQEKYSKLIKEIRDSSEDSNIYNLVDKNQDAIEELVSGKDDKNGKSCLRQSFLQRCANGGCVDMARKFVADKKLVGAAATALVAFWTKIQSKANDALKSDNSQYAADDKRKEPATHGPRSGRKNSDPKNE